MLSLLPIENPSRSALGCRHSCFQMATSSCQKEGRILLPLPWGRRRASLLPSIMIKFLILQNRKQQLLLFPSALWQHAPSLPQPTALPEINFAHYPWTIADYPFLTENCCPTLRLLLGYSLKMWGPGKQDVGGWENSIEQQNRLLPVFSNS